MLARTLRIAAPTARVFDVLCDDRMREAEDAFVTLKHITAGPLRTGFRYRRTAPHGDHRCATDVEITKFQRPWVLEERVTHVCMASARQVSLVVHHEVVEHDDHAADLVVGIRRTGGGLVSRLLARGRDRSMLLKVTEYVRHEAQKSAAIP